MAIVYTRRHMALDKKIRCSKRGKNIRLCEMVNVSHAHTCQFKSYF